MRIVGGAFKGRTLYGFEGKEIRPTSDSARESLFNILGDLSGAEFLDLFSGTGAVGIEAASRGAVSTFNDLRRDSVELISANLNKLGVRAEVFCRDALDFIRSSRKKYDVIFCDPPYKSQTIKELMDSVSSAVKEDGRVILENEVPFCGVAKGLVLYDVRKYGRAVLSFFKKQKDGAAVYAGTFDPVTVGHVNSVNAAIQSFGKVFLTVGHNPLKIPFFSEDERLSMVRAAFKGKNVTAVRFSDFKNETEYADFLKKENVLYYVRGIRDEEDFVYEKKAEKRNAAVYPFIQTAYIFCDEAFKKVHSSAIKTALLKGKDVLQYIPENAREMFAEIMKKREEKK